MDLTINNPTTGTDTQIACISYTWIDGITYTSSNNTATFTLTNAAGCDSVVTLDLTITTFSTGTDTQVSCGPFTWIDGITYTTSNNSATFTLVGGSVNGCDSIVTLDLTVNAPTTGTDTQTACDSFTWIDGITYTSSNNTATFTLTNAAGCDSLVTLDLTINNSTTGTDTQIACDSYTWIDGITYTSTNNTATFTLTNAAGCDSVVTLDLTINNATTGTDTQVACNSYTWIDGITYTSSNNTATFTLTNAAGCDSVVTLDLTINNSSTGTDTQVACNSYTWIDGITYTASNNTATFTLTNVAGCDSVVTLDLTITTSTSGTDTQISCGPYTWIDGITYTSSNNTATYTLIGGSVNGCDSIVTLDLTVNTPTTGTDIQLACGSYTWIDGVTYTTSNNTATFTLTNAAGCDSVVTLNLTINSATTGTDTQVACDSYTWIDGITYTSSNNTATFTLIGGSISGCDSIVSLDLTVLNSTGSVDSQTACGSYTWMNGVTYTSSNNTATMTFTNSIGCDSIVTLDLTILPTSNTVDTYAACDAFTWIDGVTYTSSNNTAMVTLTNMFGCDSVVTLDLTIYNSTGSVDVQTACVSYTWINGVTYTSSNNTATISLPNSIGCDSVITLDLTIIPVDTSVTNTGSTLTANATGASYQWYDCGTGSIIPGETNQSFTTTASGYFAVIVTENGCTDTSSCYPMNNASIDGLTQTPFRIYPNPTEGLITIEFDHTNNSSDNQVQVYDVQGRVIEQFEITQTETAQFELNGQPGLYMVKITNQDGRSWSMPIMKQ